MKDLLSLFGCALYGIFVYTGQFWLNMLGRLKTYDSLS